MYISKKNSIGNKQNSIKFFCEKVNAILLKFIILTIYVNAFGFEILFNTFYFKR